MEDKRVKVTQGLLLLLAAVCICLGIFREETSTVFTKAVNICLECIGIG